MNRWVRLLKSESGEHFLALWLQLNRHLAGDGGDATSSSNVVSRRTPPPAVITCKCMCGKLLKRHDSPLCYLQLSSPCCTLHSSSGLKGGELHEIPRKLRLELLRKYLKWEDGKWNKPARRTWSLCCKTASLTTNGFGLDNQYPWAMDMQVWHKYKTLMSKKTSLTTKTTPKQSIETRMTSQRKPRCEWTPTWRWLRSTNLRVTTHRPPARAAITFWFDFFRHCQVFWYITSFADILAERNHLFAHTFFFSVNMSYYMGYPDE